MDAVQIISDAFRKAFQISGRANRSEFVPFICLAILALLAVNALQSSLLLMRFADTLKISGEYDSGVMKFLRAIPVLCCVGIASALFSSVVRRFHDLGLSMLWAAALYLLPILAVGLPMLLAFISLLIWPKTGAGDDGRGIGSAILAGYLLTGALVIDIIAMCFLCFTPSQPGPNRFGPNPSEVTS
ncbi:DUF805 domain-containing protein [Cypionkella sinensis]|uniref:DUF805 domain-containing protein n=1 Tax=Cypionkella sinensis TaxID=1756043 RepID=A0ABV7J0D9_9RHOB